MKVEDPGTRHLVPIQETTEVNRDIQLHPDTAIVEITSQEEEMISRENAMNDETDPGNVMTDVEKEKIDQETVTVARGVEPEAHHEPLLEGHQAIVRQHQEGLLI